MMRVLRTGLGLLALVILALAWGPPRLSAQESLSSIQFEDVFRSTRFGRIEDMRLARDGRTGLIRYEEQIVVADFLTHQVLHRIPRGVRGLQGGDVLAMDLAPRSVVCFFVVRRQDGSTVIVRLAEGDLETGARALITPWEAEDQIYEIHVNERAIGETVHFDLLVASRRGLQVVDADSGNIQRQWASGIPCLALARSADGTRLALSYGNRVDVLAGHDFSLQGRANLRFPVHHMAFFHPESARLLCVGEEAGVLTLGATADVAYLRQTELNAATVIPHSSGVLLSEGKNIHFVRDAIQAPGSSERYKRNSGQRLLRLEYLAATREMLLLEKGGDCLRRATFIPFVTADKPPVPEVLSPRPGATFGTLQQEIQVKLLGPKDRTAAGLRVRVDGLERVWQPADLASQGPVFLGGGTYRLLVTLPAQDCTVTVETVNRERATACEVPIPLRYADLQPELELVHPRLEDGAKGISQIVTDAPRLVLGLRVQGVGMGDVLDAKVKFNGQSGLFMKRLRFPPKGYARRGDEDVRWYELNGWDHSDGRLVCQVSNGRNHSREVPVDLRWMATRENAAIYALFVGVDTYASKAVQPALPNSRKGAVAMQEMLRQQTGLKGGKLAFDKLLTGREATRENVLKALDDLQDQIQREKETTGSTNVITLVYWSGHGERNERMGGRFELLPHDGEFNGRLGRNLTGAELRDVLQNLTGSTVLVLETCHSGAMTSLGADRVKALSAGDKPLYVLASSTEEQSTLASDDQPLGYFTDALLSGIYGGIRQEDPQAWLTFSDLSRHVRLKIAGSEIGAKQTVVAGEEACWATDGKAELSLFRRLDPSLRKIQNQH